MPIAAPLLLGDPARTEATSPHSAVAKPRPTAARPRGHQHPARPRDSVRNTRSCHRVVEVWECSSLRARGRDQSPQRGARAVGLRNHTAQGDTRLHAG
jgi:hypothetical protein